MITLACDGACWVHTTKCGGTGVVMRYEFNSPPPVEVAVHHCNTTSQRMELQALIGAMTISSEEEATIYTDSQYAYHTWVGDWKPKENLELVAKVKALRRPKLTVEWLPRNSTPAMQRADALSKAAVSDTSTPCHQRAQQGLPC